MTSQGLRYRCTAPGLPCGVVGSASRQPSRERMGMPHELQGTCGRVCDSRGWKGGKLEWGLLYVSSVSAPPGMPGRQAWAQGQHLVYGAAKGGGPAPPPSVAHLQRGVAPCHHYREASGAAQHERHRHIIQGCLFGLQQAREVE
jgi:hypothetical protein